MLMKMMKSFQISRITLNTELQNSINSIVQIQIGVL